MGDTPFRNLKSEGHTQAPFGKLGQPDQKQMANESKENEQFRCMIYESNKFVSIHCYWVTFKWDIGSKRVKT